LNQVQLQARIAQMHPLRYTPAGLPALDLLLEHRSQATEAGHLRQVSLSLRAVALGAPAETLAQASLDSDWLLKGFLGMSRNGKGVVFHIQDIQRT
jgi:primosomal replication protein N